MLHCFVGFACVSPSPVETKNIVFAKYGNEELKLDVSCPASNSPTPVVLLIHGGGWVGGVREETDFAVPGFNGSGFACIRSDYRAAPKAQYPAQLIDVKAAVRWIKENARKYNFDKNRIAVFGYAAGGHLAAMLATTGQEVKWDTGCKVDSSIGAAVSFCGSTDLPTIWRHRKTQSILECGVIESNLPAFLGGTFEQVPQTYKDASPIYHITRLTTPIMFVHGEEDAVIPKEQPRIMHRILQSQGVESEVVLVPGAGHRQTGPDPEGLFRKVIVFLKKQLKCS